MSGKDFNTNTANHDEWLTPSEIIGTDIHYLPLIPPINETGKKYGRLTVLELVAKVRELERQRDFFLKALKENFMCPYSICKYVVDSDLDEWECTAENNGECWIQAAKEAGE